MTDDEKKHIANTHYKRHGAAKLVSYISRNDSTILNRAGMEMTGREQQDFLDKSEHYEFTRDYMVSPINNDLSDQEMEEAVRDSLNDYFEGESVDFCYAIHDDTDEKHAHVALTGEVDDLRMDADDLRDFKETSKEIFKEVEHDYEILRLLDRDEEYEQELEQDHRYA